MTARTRGGFAPEGSAGAPAPPRKPAERGDLERRMEVYRSALAAISNANSGPWGTIAWRALREAEGKSA